MDIAASNSRQLKCSVQFAASTILLAAQTLLQVNEGLRSLDTAMTFLSHRNPHSILLQHNAIVSEQIESTFLLLCKPAAG
jgi:hypothetical protein